MWIKFEMSRYHVWPCRMGKELGFRRTKGRRVRCKGIGQSDKIIQKQPRDKAKSMVWVFAGSEALRDAGSRIGNHAYNLPIWNRMARRLFQFTMCILQRLEASPWRMRKQVDLRVPKQDAKEAKEDDKSRFKISSLSSNPSSKSWHI